MDHEEKGSYVVCESADEPTKCWIGIFHKMISEQFLVVELKDAYEYVVRVEEATVSRGAVPLNTMWSSTEGVFKIRSLVKISKEEYTQLMRGAEGIRSRMKEADGVGRIRLVGATEMPSS